MGQVYNIQYSGISMGYNTFLSDKLVDCLELFILNYIFFYLQAK
jgi:hypothetical protein